MDKLEAWLNKKEPHATAALELFHRECLEAGAPPEDLRDRVNRIKSLLLGRATTDYPYNVLFNRGHLASTVRDLSEEDLAKAPAVARRVAFDAAEATLRSSRTLLPSSRGKPVSIASRIKTAMRLAMRSVVDQYGIPRV